MHMRRLRGTVQFGVLLALVLSLVLAASAAAETVRLGPKLGIDTGTAVGCALEAPDCAYSDTTLVPSLALNAQAPVGGTITSWSVEDFDGTARLLVLTANEDGTYTVTARSPEEAEPCVISSICGPASGVVYTFSSNLAIAAGQYIGVELISPANCKESPDDETCTMIGFSDPNAGSPSLSDRHAYFEPTPVEGSPQAPKETHLEGEILVSAELQTAASSQTGSSSSSSGGGGSSSGATSHGTATKVICDLTIAIGSDTCTATVVDTSSSGATAPTGQVSFSSASGGLFNAGDTCTLVAEPRNWLVAH